MKWKTVLGGSLVAAALIIFGYFYLDIRLAEFVCRKAGPRFIFSQTVSNMPDILLLLVCTISVLSWSGRFYLTLKSEKGLIPDFLELIGWAVPLAFVLKYPLKGLFGKTDTRVWLLQHDLFGFHWFHGGGAFSGFPSGHMAVFTALMLAVCRYFPRLRPACAGLLLVLALALIVTQYHFFSDIVAGVYVGFLVDSLTSLWLSSCHRRSAQTDRVAT